MGNRRHLNDSDVAVLREVIGWYRRTFQNPDSDQLQDPLPGPDVYLCATDGIGARLDNTPGHAGCDLWTITGVESFGIEPIEESEGVPFTQVVVNPMTVAYSTHDDAPNTLAIRAKSGHYIGIPLPNAAQEVVTAVRIDDVTGEWQYKKRTILAICLDDESDWLKMAEFYDCVSTA